MEEGVSLMDFDLFEVARKECFSVLNVALDNLSWYILDVNCKDKNGYALLHYAAEKGNVETTAKLLSLKACPDILTKDCLTPLHLACLNGHMAVVRLLLQNSARINLKDLKGQSPIFLAVRNGDEALVKYLITQGADINATDIVNDSLLHIAVQRGDEKLVKFFIGSGQLLDLDSKNSCGETPLMLAVKCGASDIVIGMLLNCKVDLSIRDHKNRNLLHLAVSGGYFNICKKLLAKNVDPNALDDEGRSPLHIAAERNHATLIELLVRNSANINQQDFDDYTPLHVAASQQNNGNAVSMLVKLKANTEALTVSGELPIHRAAASGNDKAFMLLYTRDSSQQKTRFGLSAKALAAEGGKNSIWEMLENLEKTNDQMRAPKRLSTRLPVAKKDRRSVHF